MRALCVTLSINLAGMIDWLMYINLHGNTQLPRPSYWQHVLHETQNLITVFLEVHVEMFCRKGE